MKQNLLLKWALVVAFILVLVGCASSQCVNGNKRVNVNAIHHVVFCWLKTPGDKQAMDQLIRASHRFADIPGVLSVSAGPSVPSERPVVDSSFDVAIVIVLKDKAALESYLVHPKHKAATQNILRPLVEKILIYDFVAQGPPL